MEERVFRPINQLAISESDPSRTAYGIRCQSSDLKPPLADILLSRGSRGEIGALVFGLVDGFGVMTKGLKMSEELPGHIVQRMDLSSQVTFGAGVSAFLIATQMYTRGLVRNDLPGTKFHLEQGLRGIQVSISRGQMRFDVLEAGDRLEPVITSRLKPTVEQWHQRLIQSTDSSEGRVGIEQFTTSPLLRAVGCLLRVLGSNGNEGKEIEEFMRSGELFISYVPEAEVLPSSLSRSCAPLKIMQLQFGYTSKPLVEGKRPLTIIYTLQRQNFLQAETRFLCACDWMEPCLMTVAG